MSTQLPLECLRILKEQDDVITLGQAVSAGVPAKAVRALAHAGRWQVMHRGVYAAFTGKPSRQATLWAALLRAGPDAVLSHQSAAALWGLVSSPDPVIHVTVPHDSRPDRCGPIPGVVVHRSRSLQRARHPVLMPPRTRIEETVLDLVDGSRNFDEVYDWICRAIGRRRTTAQRIWTALQSRPRTRWRLETALSLGYAEGGALSVLELRYVRGVERAHGLPAATRQARIRHETGNRYLDNLYVDYRACVEIDGTAAHPEDEQWRDKSRDRWNAVHEGIDTIRIGVRDLISKERQCRVAADVTKWLSGRGPRVGYPCGPGCPVRLLGVLKARIWVLNTPNFSAKWLMRQKGAGGMAGFGARETAVTGVAPEEVGVGWAGCLADEVSGGGGGVSRARSADERFYRRPTARGAIPPSPRPQKPWAGGATQGLGGLRGGVDAGFLALGLGDGGGGAG
jgi:hypothetical protein